MIVQVAAKYLNAEARQFTNDQGQQIDFYRVQVLDYPELNPMLLPLSRECYETGLPFDKLEDVVLTLSITARQNGNVRVQVQHIQAA